jgi:hypothetical protein
MEPTTCLRSPLAIVKEAVAEVSNKRETPPHKGRAS